MKLLDLFCGAGGCSVGYRLAGFTDITGVDRDRQPNYPFRFIRGDWSSVDLSQYDFIHASPPCQLYTALCKVNEARGLYYDYQDLVGPVREALIASGKPYVIENVIGAPLKNPIMLCGEMFGLKVYRHRIFETSFKVLQPKHNKHERGIGHLHRNNKVNEHGFVGIFGNFGIPLDYARYAMGISWMNRKEITQAIPPAYTEYLGRQYLKRYT